VSKIFLHSIELAGFRAYLKPQIIEIKSRNLAIFAPNGRGKSSLADAVEFYLTPLTTLPRFGEKAVGNQAGYLALAHNAAEKAGITPSVTLTFRAPGEAFGEARLPDGKSPRTEAGNRVAAYQRVDPVIRGHALRSFVESTSPDDRYTLVSDWLSLSPLTDAQKAIKALRSQVRTDVKDEAQKSEAERRISRITGATVKAWDLGALRSWLRSTYLNAFRLGDIEFEFVPDDSVLAKLRALVHEAEASIGLTALKQRLSAIQKIAADPDAEKGIAAGALVAFDDAALTVKSAAEIERAERASAADSVFNDVWKAAESLLSSASEAHETCPICTSTWSGSPLKSRSGARAHVMAKLNSLRAFEAARNNHAAAVQTLTSRTDELRQSLIECAALFRELDPILASVCEAIVSGMKVWQVGTAKPDTTELVRLLGQASSGLQVRIASAQSEQNDRALTKALAAFEDLVDIFRDLEIDRSQREQLSVIVDELDRQATFIGSEIRMHITELLNELRTGTNDIYRAIQGESAALVKLELPKESDKLQNRLNLVVDFAENRKSVAPSGYLSDSQLHSRALALRLAAIRRFNPDMPLLVLDDVSTSYDADYRRHLVTALKHWLGDCQLVVLTHDQRFFAYLREMLPAGEWDFKQILSLDPAYGPKMTGHMIKDAEIEQAWADGKSAANLMRQIEDETLLRWAQDFEVDIRIRKTARPFDYGRAELAEAIGRHFKELGLKPPSVPGVFNSFLGSLRDGTVENFGSHFQDGPYGDGSDGDERARWAEFKSFRSAMCCPECGGFRFMRPHPLRKGICAKPGCQAPFAFATDVAGRG
jgi:hypothetical protein